MAGFTFRVKVHRVYRLRIWLASKLAAVALKLSRNPKHWQQVRKDRLTLHIF